MHRVQEPRRRRVRPRRCRVQLSRPRITGRRSSSSSTTTSTARRTRARPTGPESIAQAIHACGAHRIGHGTRLRENGDLLNYVNDHRIPLEICLSSNIQTGAAPDLASHPLPFFYSYGLRVTINTDNRLVTDTTVSKELHLVHRTFGLELADLKEIIVDGWKSTFLPYREKADMLRKITRELELFTGDEAKDAALRAAQPPRQNPRR